LQPIYGVDIMVEYKGFLGWIYRLCQWLMNLVFLNLLWLFYCFGGLAFFPSTVAMFSVTRKWILQDREISIFKTFWHSYKNEFWKTQLLGIIYSIVTILFYFNYEFLFNQAAYTSLIVGKIVLLSLGIIYLSALLYFFPIYVHFELRTFTYFKNTILIGLLNLFSGIIMLFVVILIAIVLIGNPALIFVFGGSITALWITWMAHKTFKKIHQKKEKYNSPAA
jgi:uncharacterized membrane protein YesL